MLDSLQGVKPEADWFNKWFNTSYYHLLYNNRSEAEAEAFITALFETLVLKPGQKALDVACGKGRHARSFNKLGLDVTGIDLAPASIAGARQIAIENKLSQIRFEVYDMREVFAIKSFDLVTNLFTSLGYFDHKKDNLRAIQAMSMALKPDGLLVIDYLNPAPVLARLPWQQVISRGGIDFEILKWSDQDFIYKNIRFKDYGQNYLFAEQVQILNEDWFKAALEDNDLELVNHWGNYQLDPFDPVQSERLILVAQKKA